MPLRLEHTNELLSRRGGLVLVDRFGKKIDLSRRIDAAFPAPGSNRGFPASRFVTTLIEMLVDGGSHLEDVRSMEADTAYKKMTERDHFPTSDALGDWLRRQGATGGSRQLAEVHNALVREMTTGHDEVLDIDTTLIVAEKGDAVKSYKGFRAYHPLVGALTSLGVFLAPRFQPGNTSPQADLVGFVQECQEAVPGRIGWVRSDSAAYNHAVINYCTTKGLRFTITADHDVAVMGSVARLPHTAWKRGKSTDGGEAGYDVAETIHQMEGVGEAFRLVIKRRERTQTDLFEDYHYWIIATNAPREVLDAQGVIDHHEQRGEMERMIGELKTQMSMEHLPCGQYVANDLYFGIGVLAYNLIVFLKQKYFGAHWRRKTLRSLRYWFLHAPMRLVSHAGYLIARLAVAPAVYDVIAGVYRGLSARAAPA
jgi:hypothetical protein